MQVIGSKNSKLCNEDICTGCGACFNICPVNAVKMQENEQGFYSPVINNEICTNCNLCTSVCPIINIEQNKNTESPKCYACYSFDNKNRFNSSSGGIFSELAKDIFALNGYAAGVQFDENMLLEHVLVNNFEDLKKLRSSKYLQSNTKTIYKDIKNLLDKNNYVLFTGTPCQAAGLKSYLRKPYEKLLTADLVCHGVPSPLVWKKYLNELEQKYASKVIGANFRHKKYGWSPSLLILLFEDGRTLEENSNENLFYRLFLRDISTKKSCSLCKYAKIPRQGDITIGDFWGIWTYKKELSDNKGISLLLINNEKGDKYFSRLNIFKEEIPLEIGVNNNPVLKRPCARNVKADSFFENLKNKSLTEAVQITNNNLSKNVAILNFAFASNYGANLTNYALNKIVKDLNYNVRTIKYLFPNYDNSPAQRFNCKYINSTNEINNYSDFLNLNNDFDTFIVGSDQIFRFACYENLKNLLNFYLAFANNDKKIISMSASFALDKLEENVKDFKIKKQIVKSALNRFDAISVREYSGVDICKNEFEINAELIIDPVFLLGASQWEALTDSSNAELPKNYVAAYILDKKETNMALIKNIADKYGKETVFIDYNKHENVDFLKILKESDFIVTDSFHGSCFAVIFNKQFICLSNKFRGFARFTSIFKLLDLPFQNLLDENCSNLSDDYVKIDYDKVNENIKKNKTAALQYLKNALEQPPKKKEEIEVCFKKNIKEERVKYYKYKILSKILIGKKRKHYKAKRNLQKEIIKREKELIKILGTYKHE